MSILRFSFVMLIFLLFSCGTDRHAFADRQQTHCINRLLKADTKIGLIRNKQCETLSLSQTIINYTDAMNAITSQNCPDGFATAYQAHRDAWLAMLPITDKYPDMRGEMHVLFRQLEQSDDAGLFKKQLNKIWSTWAEVERFVQK